MICVCISAFIENVFCYFLFHFSNKTVDYFVLIDNVHVNTILQITEAIKCTFQCCIFFVTQNLLLNLLNICLNNLIIKPLSLYSKTIRLWRDCLKKRRINEKSYNQNLSFNLFKTEVHKCDLLFFSS